MKARFTDEQIIGIIKEQGFARYANDLGDHF